MSDELNLSLILPTLQKVHPESNVAKTRLTCYLDGTWYIQEDFGDLGYKQLAYGRSLNELQEHILSSDLDLATNDFDYFSKNYCVGLSEDEPERSILDEFKVNDKVEWVSIRHISGGVDIRKYNGVIEEISGTVAKIKSPDFKRLKKVSLFELKVVSMYLED